MIREWLTEKTGSPAGMYRGALTEADQMRLFGRFFGGGFLVVDGVTESVHYWHYAGRKASVRFAELTRPEFCELRIFSDFHVLGE